jgi:hypothetical protein
MSQLHARLPRAVLSNFLALRPEATAVAALLPAQRTALLFNPAKTRMDREAGGDHWTREEDERLVQLHRCFGNNWEKICEGLPTRSQGAVWNRWNRVLARQPVNVFGSLVLTGPPVISKPAARPAPVDGVVAPLWSEEDDNRLISLHDQGLLRDPSDLVRLFPG